MLSSFGVWRYDAVSIRAYLPQIHACRHHASDNDLAVTFQKERSQTRSRTSCDFSRKRER